MGLAERWAQPSVHQGWMPQDRATRGLADVVTIRIPWQTPSGNEYRKWHWSRQHAEMLRCQHQIWMQLRLQNDPLELWPEKPQNHYGGFRQCAADRCKRKGDRRDRRGNFYCASHLQHAPAPVRRVVTYTRYCVGRLDFTNLAMGCKALEDGLVNSGVLYDDSEDWVSARYEQKRCRRGEGFTEIVIRTEQ